MNIDCIFFALTFIFGVVCAFIASEWKSHILLLTQVSLLVFYNPVSNKILVIITIIHLTYLIAFRARNLLKINGAKVLTFISILMIYCGTTGLRMSTSIDLDNWGSVVLSPVVTGPLLAISILSQLRNAYNIYTFLKVYAIARMLETAVVGIVIYAFFQNELQLLDVFLDGYARLDFDETRRLISISSRNANEAAFLLLPAAIFFFNYFKVSNTYKVYFFVTLIAIILTWTRSALVLFLMYMLFSNMKLNWKQIQKPALQIIFVVLIVASYIFVSYHTDPSRLLTFETIDMRFTQYTDYLGSVGKLNFMSGIVEDIWTKSSMLNLSYNISSENVFIEFLYKYGLIPGVLIIYFHLVASTKSIYYLLFTRSFAASESKISNGGRLVFITYLILFVAANTTSFEQSSILWIIGLLALNVSRIYKSSH